MTIARELVRQSDEAGTPSDPLGMNATKRIAQQILDTVRDANLFPSVAMKVARQVAERRLPPGELAELLDGIVANRKSISKPGAYFVTGCKRLFRKHELRW